MSNDAQYSNIISPDIHQQVSRDQSVHPSLVEAMVRGDQGIELPLEPPPPTSYRNGVCQRVSVRVGGGGRNCWIRCPILTMGGYMELVPVTVQLSPFLMILARQGTGLEYNTFS